MRLRMISIRKNDIRCFLLWLLSIVVIIWVNENAYYLIHCVNKIQKNYKKIINNSNDGEIITIKTTNSLDRNTPLIFVGGVPRYQIRKYQYFYSEKSVFIPWPWSSHHLNRSFNLMTALFVLGRFETQQNAIWKDG